MDDENARRYASIQDIRRHIVNACIQWARIKGYSDSAGFLMGFLAVLSKEPVSLDELAHETGYSKSTVSSNMNRLEDLGQVKRIVISGDRRHLYAPITDPEIIRTNMLDAINKEIQIFCEALERTKNDLTVGGVEAGYLLERVAALKQSYERGKKTIEILRKQPLNEIAEIARLI
ncbi:MAG: winged helix-turn-helix transcriptional regulator [Methanothrix sp.]|jgi:DNA-binding transcriptional regulator GbsR (MarR family)|nr:winged helix-turn-helix transcriptional regulator [Methanothrix sp.]